MPVPEPELEPDLYRDLLVRTLDHGKPIQLLGSPILAAGFEDRRNSIERETGRMESQDRTSKCHPCSMERFVTLVQHSIGPQAAVAGLAVLAPLVVLHKLIKSGARRSGLGSLCLPPSYSHNDITFCSFLERGTCEEGSVPRVSSLGMLMQSQDRRLRGSRGECRKDSAQTNVLVQYQHLTYSST